MLQFLPLSSLLSPFCCWGKLVSCHIEVILLFALLQLSHLDGSRCTVFLSLSLRTLKILRKCTFPENSRPINFPGADCDETMKIPFIAARPSPCSEYESKWIVCFSKVTRKLVGINAQKFRYELSHTQLNFKAHRKDGFFSFFFLRRDTCIRPSPTTMVDGTTFEVAVTSLIIVWGVTCTQITFCFAFRWKPSFSWLTSPLQ